MTLCEDAITTLLKTTTETKKILQSLFSKLWVVLQVSGPYKSWFKSRITSPIREVSGPNKIIHPKLCRDLKLMGFDLYYDP